jgi:hypothetical protein
MEMVNKLRDVMGKRDDAFFSTEIPLENKERPLKRGRGSQKKTKQSTGNGRKQNS